MNENKILSLSNINKIYKFKREHNHVLKDINLEIKKGDFITIEGKSGSGKSTLLNIISGIIKPTSGKVILDGKDMTKRFDPTISYHRGHVIGFIFQSFNLIRYQTVIENVTAPLKFQTGENLNHKEMGLKALKAVELEDKINYYPNLLSGGQMQRTAIARAIVKNPKLIIADEPTGNLDKETSYEIMSIFKRLNSERNITFIIVTHDKLLTEHANQRFKLQDRKLTKFD